MIANGWRPLTNSYEETIGTNVSPSSHLEKNIQVHPVLNKFQEHMATSEKLKPLRKSKPPIHEYSPPSILGSFTVFGHAATKARGEAPPKVPPKLPHKHLPSETREYTFLVPPPKDAHRFEMNQHRKPILRDNSNYLRQPQYPTQNVRQQHEPVRAASYFIKGYTSTTNPSTDLAHHPSNRPYVPPFAMPQALQPPRHQAKPFESFKVSSNAKPYFQPPGVDVLGDFGKQKVSNDAYDRYQPAQSHSTQVLNAAAGSGNFYSQVNHPPSQFKTSYERDPAFLVHESHEVSYVTPSDAYNGYNFRPSLPYETLLPPAVYTSSSTATPSTTAVTRNPGQTDELQHDYKRTDQRTRKKQEKGRTESPDSRSTSTYYVSEHQDLTPPSWSNAANSKYTSDINEVLPRENLPAKFSQENQNQITQVPKVPYHGSQNVFEPVEIYQQTSVPEYETPESISLKHFNEQQFLLQQQLLQRDRERLAEQERQQKLEIEQRRQEELKKQEQQQEELNQLVQEDKEDDVPILTVTRNQSRDIAKLSEHNMPYTIQLAHFEPHVTTDVNYLLSEPGIYNVQQLRLQPQVIFHFVIYLARITNIIASE